MKGSSDDGGHDIVVIGCSAGGVEALPTLLSKFPRNTPASFFVVMHISAMTESYRPRIISRHAKMPCEHAGRWRFSRGPWLRTIRHPLAVE